MPLPEGTLNLYRQRSLSGGGVGSPHACTETAHRPRWAGSRTASKLLRDAYRLYCSRVFKEPGGKEPWPATGANVCPALAQVRCRLDR